MYFWFRVHSQNPTCNVYRFNIISCMKNLESFFWSCNTKYIRYPWLVDNTLIYSSTYMTIDKMDSIIQGKRISTSVVSKNIHIIWTRDVLSSWVKFFLATFRGLGQVIYQLFNIQISSVCHLLNLAILLPLVHPKAIHLAQFGNEQSILSAV